MECVTAKSKIQETFKEVAELANQKNVKALREEAVNNFLDRISVFRDALDEKTKTITDINSKFEILSWVEGIDEECLELIKGLLQKSNAVHKKLIRSYVEMSWVITKGIAIDTMRKYKIALDDLKEDNQDLEDLYFNLPADAEFADRIKMLSK
jgi:predicted nuclease with TOPRIM domain